MRRKIPALHIALKQGVAQITDSVNIHDTNAYGCTPKIIASACFVQYTNFQQPSTSQQKHDDLAAWIDKGLMLTQYPRMKGRLINYHEQNIGINTNPTFWFKARRKSRPEERLLFQLWVAVDSGDKGCAWSNDGGLSVIIHTPRLFRDVWLNTVWKKELEKQAQAEGKEKEMPMQEEDGDDDEEMNEKEWDKAQAEGKEKEMQKQKEKGDDEEKGDEYLKYGSFTVFRWAKGRMRELGFALTQMTKGRLRLEHPSFQMNLLRNHDIGVVNVWRHAETDQELDEDTDTETDGLVSDID